MKKPELTLRSNTLGRRTTLTLILMLLAIATFIMPQGSPNSGSGPREIANAALGKTFQGNYALHMKTTLPTDAAQISRQSVGVTILSGRTYEINASVYVVSESTGEPFILSFNTSFSGNYPVSLYLSGSNEVYPSTILWTAGRAQASAGQAWATGKWFDLSLRLIGNSGNFYLNGTLVTSFVNTGLLDGTLLSYSIESKPLSEIYVDSINISQDSVVQYSEGFENGLADFEVSRTAAAIVDTVYSGPGSGSSSTLLSTGVLPGVANLGTNSQVQGTLVNASSLIGVAGAMISIDVSWDSGLSYETVGSSMSNQNGNFSAGWTPSLIGVALVRASYAGSSSLFRSHSLLTVTVGKAISQLSLSLSPSMESSIGLNVLITGFLTGLNSKPVQNANILLTLTVVNGSNSTSTVQSALTLADGSYRLKWLPNATGPYDVIGSWAGDGTNSPARDDVLLLPESDGAGSVFWVASDALVSGIKYDTAGKIVSLTVSGPSGVSRYLDLLLPTSMVGTANGVGIHLNVTDARYKTEQIGNVIRVHISFNFQGPNFVEVFLTGETFSLWQIILTYGSLTTVGLVAVGLALWWSVRRRSKKTIPPLSRT